MEKETKKGSKHVIKIRKGKERKNKKTYPAAYRYYHTNAFSFPLPIVSLCFFSVPFVRNAYAKKRDREGEGATSAEAERERERTPAIRRGRA